MKNHLSTKIQGFLFIIVYIGLMFGLAACSTEKTIPAVTVSPVQKSLDISPSNTPVIQHPAEMTAIPVPDIASLPTAENGALKNEQTTAILTPEPLFKIGSTQVSPKDGMEMVYVPRGTFEMGIDMGVHFNPGHTVYLDSYWIDKTDVTNAMYASCVDSGACGEIHSQKNIDTVFKGANQPVVFVNWNDANDYCRWAGRRLPTDAEWEKAARGTDGRTYPWGNQKPAGNLLNFADINSGMDDAEKNIDDGFKLTSPVGNYPDGASPYGALDMAGNAFQWVADYWYGGNYAGLPDKNPQGPSSGEDRVIRGGSWGNNESGIRYLVNGKLSSPPDMSMCTTSFRCAMNAEPPN